ncbi:MAG TPA: hypothetical protein VFZ65_23840 [Planctomycetota bacterium]|nr:hypothetical protein [Planctomycetota bacterium]
MQAAANDDNLRKSCISGLRSPARAGAGWLLGRTANTNNHGIRVAAAKRIAKSTIASAAAAISAAPVCGMCGSGAARAANRS